MVAVGPGLLQLYVAFKLFWKWFDMLQLISVKGNKTISMFTALAYKWKTPSSVHLLVIWISPQNHPTVDISIGKQQISKVLIV